MTDSAKPKKRARLRAIDTGTRYDIVGNLKRLARAIERGELGDVRDCVVGVREIRPGGGVSVEARHFGTGTVSDAMYTVDGVRKQLLP